MSTQVSTGDRLWSAMPYLRPIATITKDTLDWCRGRAEIASTPRLQRGWSRGRGVDATRLFNSWATVGFDAAATTLMVRGRGVDATRLFNSWAAVGLDAAAATWMVPWPRRRCDPPFEFLGRSGFRRRGYINGWFVAMRSG